MSGGPLIGITGRRRPGTAIGVPVGFADAPVDAYLAEYATSVISAGGLPVYVPLDVDIALLVRRLDGLILAGGEDVDPDRYGAARGSHTGPSDPLRDELELDAVRLAMASSLPVLGICRGHQVINVALGGSLIQHLDEPADEAHLLLDAHRRDFTHEVLLKPDTRAMRLYGARTWVNSFHHQAVDRLGHGLLISGSSPAGVVEAIEHETAPVLGIQWHPETFGNDPAFDWVVSAANELRGLKRAPA